MKLFSAIYFYAIVLSILLFNNCQIDSEDEPVENQIKGNWAFLNVAGHYNEAYFGDSTYMTYNQVYGALPELRYELKSDSLWSEFNRGDILDSIRPIAKIEWLDINHMVIVMKNVRDTLQRVTGEGITLEQYSKSTKGQFMKDFMTRYEEFLLERGILTEEEIQEQRKMRKSQDTLNPVS